MKKILITGANSYIGTSFENYMKNFEGYQIDTLDMLGGSWTEYDFSGYDVIFHVAGIAHRKETKENRALYYNVNHLLAVAVAIKAKQEGVGQFVFLSTMSVYGKSTGAINKYTEPYPKSHYGKSKLYAEYDIREMETESFKVSILRPPMVYGDDCKGNYQLLRKLVRIFPVFPDYDNKRSFIHIDNLCMTAKKIIDAEKRGLFLPQNPEYMSTTDLVKIIVEKDNEKIVFTKAFNIFLKIFQIKIVKKLFGTLYYERDSTHEE